MKPQSFLFVFSLFLILQSDAQVGAEGTTDLNIYVVLDPRAITAALELNMNVTTALPYNQIHFYEGLVPHLTIFQSTFNNNELEGVVEALQVIISKFKGCTIVLQGGTTFAGFVEWQAQDNPCLRNFNTQVANALKQFRQAGQPIPSWVLDYPNPEISQALTDTFIRFGYPFVGTTFQTGVTIGYDVREATDFVLDQLNFPALSFVSKSIAISVPGLHDTIDKKNFGPVALCMKRIVGS